MQAARAAQRTRVEGGRPTEQSSLESRGSLGFAPGVLDALAAGGVEARASVVRAFQRASGNQAVSRAILARAGARRLSRSVIKEPRTAEQAASQHVENVSYVYTTVKDELNKDDRGRNTWDFIEQKEISLEVLTPHWNSDLLYLQKRDPKATQADVTNQAEADFAANITYFGWEWLAVPEITQEQALQLQERPPRHYVAPRATRGALAGSRLPVFNPMAYPPAELAATLRHEIQHLTDRTRDRDLYPELHPDKPKGSLEWLRASAWQTFLTEANAYSLQGPGFADRPNEPTGVLQVPGEPPQPLNNWSPYKPERPPGFADVTNLMGAHDLTRGRLLDRKPQADVEWAAKGAYQIADQLTGEARAGGGYEHFAVVWLYEDTLPTDQRELQTRVRSFRGPPQPVNPLNSLAIHKLLSELTYEIDKTTIGNLEHLHNNLTAPEKDALAANPEAQRVIKQRVGTHPDHQQVLERIAAGAKSPALV